MWGNIKSVYYSGLRAALLLPLLFLIPAVVEFVQHVVEVRSGMYESIAAAKAVEHDPLRMLFGFAKTIALLVPGYWFVRFMALADQSKAARIEQPAFRLWLVLLALQSGFQAYALFSPPLGSLLGQTGQASKWVGPAIAAIWSIFGLYLTAWFVAWPLGNSAIGPLRSLKIMTGSFWRTLGYAIACILPLMVVHYGLGYLAIALTPRWLDWPILAVDALIVAWLACTMAGSSLVAARHSARDKGIPLVEGAG